MKIRNGWRVVHKVEGGQYVSCWFHRVEEAGIAPNAKAVVSVPGEWAERPRDGGPLSVFDTLANAKSFVLENDRIIGDLMVLPCRYVKSRDKRLWFKLGNRMGMLVQEEFPEGTVLAERVMVSEPVRA
jgi:hypothetical protein